MNPYDVIRHFIKMNLSQVQLKISPSKYSQISIKLIASCSTMFTLPKNQFSGRLNIYKQSYLKFFGGDKFQKCPILKFVEKFWKFKIEFLEKYPVE